MPRSSSSKHTSSSQHPPGRIQTPTHPPAPPSAPPSAPTPPPAPTPTPPSLGQTVKEGFVFGAGSAIAQNTIHSLFGTWFRTHKTPTQMNEAPSAYQQCLSEHREMIDASAFCVEHLKQKDTTRIVS